MKYWLTIKIRAGRPPLFWSISESVVPPLYHNTIDDTFITVEINDSSHDSIMKHMTANF